MSALTRGNVTATTGTLGTTSVQVLANQSNNARNYLSLQACGTAAIAFAIDGGTAVYGTNGIICSAGAAPIQFTDFVPQGAITAIGVSSPAAYCIYSF